VDFFAAQELRRKKTKWLVLWYALAVLAIIVGIYVVVAIAFGFAGQPDAVVFDPVLFLIVAAVNVLVIGAASLFKIFELRSGGHHVASMMGGARVPASATGLAERRLLNVVEEMALASGISVPPVYIMENEPGINAFAAGYSPADAVIGVNRGTIEQLNRDELQGVIAHEFSHILNGDMRMNIRLIGVLFGIQMLAMIGYFLLRSLGTGHRRRSSNNKNEGGALAAIMAVAVAFLVFGSIGQFFARMIKASISRQREYLADASAVQFTRYPDGLGGALKVIGSSHAGSVVESKEAEELSHMFFANCFKSSMMSAFSTHPPLVPRIQKIDNNFTGDFVGYIKVREKMAARRAKKQQQEAERDLSELNPLGKMFPKEIAEKFSIDPAILIAAIGAPNINDVQRSQDILDQIPAAIVEAARHPYSARCIAFAMLASEDPDLRYEQSQLLRKDEGAASVETTGKLLPLVTELNLVYRLPLMEMIQASLSDLSPEQYQTFRSTVEKFVLLDSKTSLFEFVVRHHLLMHLDRRFKVQPPPRIAFNETTELFREIELMLSAFASASVTGSVLENSQEPDPAQVLESYRLAMDVAGLSEKSGRTAELRNWEVDQLEDCMRSLHRASPSVKKQFLQAAAVLITFDHEITIAEAEFFRAVAESLDCPVPLLAAGRTLRTE
jgi:Zn-dependent protease with chaperone function